MSLRLLAASLCVAAASAVAVVTKELPLAAPYFTVSAINVTAPAVISAPLPLVVMLSGYCLPADTQARGIVARGGGWSSSEGSLLRLRPRKTRAPRPSTPPTTPAPSPHPTLSAIQDSLQLGFRALAGGGGPGGGPLPASPPFVYAELRSARPVAVCDLCPTSVRAARAAGNLTAEFEAEVVAGLTVAGLCTAWAATPACCQPALPANVSDAAFVVDVVGLVSKAYPVDPNRVRRRTAGGVGAGLGGRCRSACARALMRMAPSPAHTAAFWASPTAGSSR